MALWGNTDAQSAAPKYKGVLADPTAYAATPSLVITGTFTAGNNWITSPSSTVGVVKNMRIVANNATVLAGLSTGALVQSVNSTVIVMTDTYQGTTTSGASTVLDFDFVTGYNMYNNTTVGAFQSGVAAGVFGVSSAEVAYGRSNGSAGYHSGFVEVTYGTGYVNSFSISGGSSFANGETVKAVGGSNTAVGTITSNSTGGGATVVVTSPGAGFTNASSVTASFNREKHVTVIAASGTSAYNNSSILIVSNGTVNATATLSTNSTGGLDAGTITITNVGLFANTQSANGLVITVANSTGGSNVTGNASASGFTPTLGTSSNGTLTFTLGGRAGRVKYETLVAMSGATFANGSTVDTEDVVFNQ
jgi:hypothetical protein